MTNEVLTSIMCSGIVGYASEVELFVSISIIISEDEVYLGGML